MKAESVKHKLLEAVEGFASKSILVVGDVMLDQFVWGEVSRISPEAPVPVVQVEKESFLLGGAANVANNLRSLDARVCMAGVVGDDTFGQTVLSLCERMEIETEGIVTDRGRPTTLKTRIVARGQQVVRVDREKPAPLNEYTARCLSDKVVKAMNGCQAIIVSDYDKGVICAPVMEKIIEFSSQHTIPCLIDPKPVNASLYHGASLITPNMKEAQDMTGIAPRKEKDLETAAVSMADRLDLQTVLITRGAEGMALWQREKGLFTIPTMAREVFDVTGAGDTVISLMALGLVSGLSPCEAAFLANLAAGIVVGKVGTATVDHRELKEAIRQAPVEALHNE